MTDEEHIAYSLGNRAAYRDLLGVALRGLAVEDAPNDLAAAQRRIGALEKEASDARVQLRLLCAEFGDNEWEDGDYLADVIDKHLRAHLLAPKDDEEPAR